jgi:transposase
MITLETWAYIRRRHLQDGVSISVIARELDLDRKTVRSAIARSDYLSARQRTRALPSKLDPYKKEIGSILQKSPRLSGVRILEKLRQKGYQGGKTILYDYLSSLPQRRGPVFLRIQTREGEQAQCDWGKCGTVEVAGSTRHLSCFVMLLSYSRYLYVHFYLSETMECFLDGHLRAFSAFGGIPQTILYDNLKSVVIARYGNTIHFNPTFMDFAGYHLFKPELCRPRRPHHKGKVEKGVAFVKENFLAGREHLLQAPFEASLLNQECLGWLKQQNQRLHGSTQRRPAEMLEEESAFLLPLPSQAYDSSLKKSLYADSQAFVTFQTNRYSVPHEAVGRALILKVTPYRVEIYHQQTLLASHRRSFAKQQVFENPDHRKEILKARRRARQSKEIEFFLGLDPLAKTFLEGLIQEGVKASYHIRQIMEMVDIYGKSEVLSALQKACEYHAYHFEYLENIIQQQRRERQTNAHKSPSLAAHLKRGKDIRLGSIDMSQYQIKKDSQEDE